jgi:hypothetical protein
MQVGCIHRVRSGERTGRGEMARRDLTLTDSAAIGLFYIQRYQFLTIDQFTRAASMKRPAASEQLRELERHGILGHFGNIGMPGIGKTPKVYFLKRKGWELLTRESGIPPELIGTYKETHVEAKWSPQMFDRLRTHLKAGVLTIGRWQHPARAAVHLSHPQGAVIGAHPAAAAAPIALIQIARASTSLVRQSHSSMASSCVAHSRARRRAAPALSKR